MRSKIQRWSIGLSATVWFLIASFAGGIAFEALAEIVVVPPGFTVTTCVSGIATPNKLTIAPDGSLIIVDYDTTAGGPDTTPDYIRQSKPPCNSQTSLLTVQRDSDPGVGGVAFSSDGTKMFFTLSTGSGLGNNDGEIRKSSPPGADPTVLKSGLIQPFGLALAPACFGVFAGKLIVADPEKGDPDDKGLIYAIDPDTGEKSDVTARVTLLNNPQDLAFWPLSSPDCDLYVAGQGGVVRVKSDGTVSLVKYLPYAFALAVHPVTGDLYVITRVSTFPPAHEIKKINHTTGEMTTFATADASSDLEAGEVGGGGGSLIFSPDGSTLYVSEPGLDRVAKVTSFITTGTIIAHKFHDLNGNGSQDPGEPNLSGWTMSLYSGSGCTGSALQSGTTDASGNKTFANLVAGTYSVAETLQSGWQANTATCQNVTIAVGETKTLNFGNSLLCTTGVTAFSSPHSVTYRPTLTQSAQKTIIVTLATSSSAPVTVNSILPKDGQPFTIVSITPALPVTLGSADRLAFTVVTQRAAGQGSATATAPYFNIGTSCGLITTASELTQVVPLALEKVRLELQAGQLRFEALGIGIKQINVQVFSLSGKRVYASGWVENGHEWKLRDKTGKAVANGVYLYVVTVRGYDGTVRTQVKKLVITQ